MNITVSTLTKNIHLNLMPKNSQYPVKKIISSIDWVIDNRKLFSLRIAERKIIPVNSSMKYRTSVC